MEQFKVKDVAVLKNFLTHDTPFGPDHFGGIGAENLEVFQTLFDSHNKIYSRLNSGSPLVVGRRGSGKSSFLQSRKILDPQGKKNKNIAIEINSGSIFSAICSKVVENANDDYVEKIAQTWAVVLDLCLMVAIGAESTAPTQLTTLSRVFRQKYRDSYRQRGTATAGRLIHYFDDFSAALITQIKNDVYSWTGTPLADLRQSGVKYLADSDRSATCIIDSLEEYKITKSANQSALAGLFKCVGEYYAGRQHRFKVVLSVPSELYSYFALEVSQGVIKDFSNATWLYWHASELLSVCAKRIQVYMTVYGQSIPLSYTNGSLNDRKFCLAFLMEVLPTKIFSSSGTEEDPIAYLLRHTQLIPRHIITILNQAHKDQQLLNNNFSGSDGKVGFSAEAIKSAVEKAHSTIADDIIVGYREKYPHFVHVIESIIPVLPLYFLASDVDREFRKRVKAVHIRYPKVSEYANDATSLLRTLLDVGVAGRVLEEKDRYVEAEFAYTVSRDVGFSSDDRFCFHPVFAKKFRCVYDPKRDKPVYPSGINPMDALDSN